MKKLGILSAIAVFGTILLFTDCRKKRIDPCEGIRCEEGQKCVEGKCVDIERKRG